LLRIDLADYRLLCSTLAELRQKITVQKNRVAMLLDETICQRRRLLSALGKSKTLTRRLTILQRKQLGLLLDPGKHVPGMAEIPALDKNHINSEPDPAKLPEFSENHKNLREIKAAEIRVLSMIDETKGRLLRLELLEMRLRELLVSINRALEVYDEQWQRIRRIIYPLGIFSVFFKNIRQFFGSSHFSPRDLKEIKFLGDLAGNIMKMADSPVF